MFKEKSEIGWSGGFYITNGILNYKKRTKKPKSKPYISIGDYNRQLIPDIAALCKQCKSSHLKQPVGEFKLTYKGQKRVYLVEREVWLNDLKLQSYYRLCSIYGVGKGVSKSVWNSQDKKLIVAAEAEKKANELRQQALTPAILEKMWIERWDGTVPTVITGGNTSAFLDLSKIRK